MFVTFIIIHSLIRLELMMKRKKRKIQRQLSQSPELNVGGALNNKKRGDRMVKSLK